MTDIETDCQNYTVCASMNCFSLRTNNMKVILFQEAVTFSKKFAQFSSSSINPYFIIDVFNTYKKQKDVTNPYLEIDRRKR